MYKIINAKDGSTVGHTEKPRFIKKNESSGCFVSADELTAQGLAFQSTAYNLHGREGVGAEETVVIFEYDAGEISSRMSETDAVLDNIIVSFLEG